MRVALKYCGGCDPTYERTDYFALIAAAAGGTIDWVRLDDPGHEAILLICGCPTACPEEEMPPGEPLLCLRDDGLPPARVVATLLEKETRHGHQDQG